MHQRDRGNRHTWSVAGSHHLRFKFVCVSAPFAPTQGGILVNSVHLSTYSLSGHDAPKAAASIQDAITGCLQSVGIQVRKVDLSPIGMTWRRTNCETKPQHLLERRLRLFRRNLLNLKICVAAVRQMWR